MKSLHLPDHDYDIVCSAVLFNTPAEELEKTIKQFLQISESTVLKTHLCLIDNSPSPAYHENPPHKSVSYIFTGANFGYGKAHNIALRASQNRTKYNLVMNTDIEYTPDVVLQLKSVLDAVPTAGLSAPKTIYPDGRLQHVCRLLPSPINVFLRRFFPHSSITKRSDNDYELRWWNHASVANIPFFQGSFLLLRTSICGAIGGFDERFFLYAEDIDLCRRIHTIAKTLYVPSATIVHKYRRMSSHSMRATIYSIYSHVQYFNKWGWLFDRSRAQINSRAIRELQDLKYDGKST